MFDELGCTQPIGSEGKALQNIAQPSVLERLKLRRAETDDRLKKIDRAIDYLEKNPDFQTFLTSLRDIGLC